MGRSHFQQDAKEFAMSQIKTDGDVSPQVYDYLCKLAKEWGVVVTNIAWLQMKPYPMQGALYQMLQNRCLKEGLVIKSMTVKNIQRAEVNNLRAGFEADITLFDQKSFDAIMAKASLDSLSVEMLRETRDLLTHRYHEEGWASPETVKAPAMQNVDYMNHMAATRGLDRTLRMIVRCPFTAASELPDGPPGELTEGALALDGATGEGAPILIRPGDKVAAPAASKPGPEGAPAATPDAGPSKPGKTIPQKPIKKIEEKAKDPKAEKVSEKQVSLITLQWEAYCKDTSRGIPKKDIDEKFPRLLKALYGVDSAKDLTIAQLEEMIGLMARKEIEVTYEGAPEPSEKPEVKT